MFGTGEQFAYEQCSNCRCLQITDKPANISRYYPSHYYSFSNERARTPSLKARIRSFLSLYGPASLFAGKEWWEKGDRKSLRDAAVSRSDRILDIGSGSGELIANLFSLGFRRVVGVDPFTTGDVTHRNGPPILKCETCDIEGQFEIVMMHHSLEHIWDQYKIAREIARLLAPEGRCIIRIPTIDSWAWEKYGSDWVQLDPPRHFYLHSRTSIVRLLRSTGLEVTEIIDDSSAFQILGSEKILRGHPVLNPRTGALDEGTILSPDFIAWARRQARELNKSRHGDSIAVHARKMRSK
jgi:SAM-dependent methyltransferase